MTVAEVAGHPRTREALTALLIDFANLPMRPDSDTFSAQLRHELIQVLQRIVTPDLDRVLIRLYGGWMQGGTLTAKGSRIQQAAALANPFPVKHPSKAGLLHGRIELATTMAVAPTLEMGDSYRRRAGPPRLRLSRQPVPDLCVSDADACPMRLVQKLTKTKRKLCSVEGCTVDSGRAFEVNEQKMVDTMLTCDLLHFCKTEEYVSAWIVSCDTDFVPPLIQAAVQGRDVGIVDSTQCWSPELQHLLTNAGVMYRSTVNGY